MDDEIIGYLKVNYRDAQNELIENIIIEVEGVYLLAKYQGKKIEHQLLLKHAMTLAKNIEAEFLCLAVWERL